ncbi:hypothetical protein J437_LFUL016733 [Ladona fulva]|uniref:Uncharacterized protein n=1 Tax=Ladona fulva TaxID=123851 RepID=A0A8K0KMX0_LADFU|nr:hypothetical protein J437_LFUL016733 [Ladona fulva]
MQRLAREMPYGADLPVQKVECTNHLLQNYISRVITYCDFTLLSQQQSSTGEQRPVLTKLNFWRKIYRKVLIMFLVTTKGVWSTSDKAQKKKKKI